MGELTAAMRTTLERLLAPGKGMLAPDEHADRLARALGLDAVSPLASSRHRAMVLGTPRLGDWISSVVVGPEAVYAGLPDRSPEDPVYGVRLDADGQTPHSDALKRLAALGIDFVKWRADADPVGGDGPAYADTTSLARCAGMTHEAGLVPVVDVAMPNQRSHSLGVAIAVTANTLKDLYGELDRRGVDPAGVVVRMNMIRAGVMNPQQTVPALVGRSTMHVIEAHLPAAAPGVMFMSTGMRRNDACADLAAIVEQARRTGWTRPLTFGFGGALVDRAMRSWVRQGEHAARKALAKDCEMASSTLSPLLLSA
jgi:fructose-bisphosphate aldolase, class I